MCSSRSTVLSPRRHPARPVPVPILQSLRDTSYVVTILRHRDATLLCSKQGRRCNAMASCWIRQVRHAHSMNKYEERNERTNRQVVNFRSSTVQTKVGPKNATVSWYESALNLCAFCVHEPMITFFMLGFFLGCVRVSPFFFSSLVVLLHYTAFGVVGL